MQQVQFRRHEGRQETPKRCNLSALMFSNRVFTGASVGLHLIRRMTNLFLKTGGLTQNPRQKHNFHRSRSPNWDNLGYTSGRK
jgi:hypothetical protein